MNNPATCPRVIVQDSMDPEILVPGENQMPAGPVPRSTIDMISKLLHYGLPLRSALAIFVVAGPSVTMFGFHSTMMGVLLGAILVLVRGYLLQPNGLDAGEWMMLLHHTSSLAALTSVVPALLTTPVKSQLFSWMSGYHLTFTPDLLPPAALIVLMLLFALGLERSRVLRRLLLYLLFITNVGLFSVGAFYFGCLKLYKDSEPVDYGKPVTFDNVFGATTFVVTVFLGTTSKEVLHKEREFTNPSRTLFKVGYTPLVMVFQMFAASLFFIMGAVKLNFAHGEDIFVFNVFRNGLAFGWDGLPGLMRFIFRDFFSIIALVQICLSLVEVMSYCVSFLECIASSFLPSIILRENGYTGTRLYSILLIGTISGVLTSFYSTKDLVILSGMSYFLSYAYLLICTLGSRFDPCYKMKDGKTVKVAMYQLLDDENRLIESEDSDVLSCDSGHSTDTDIDTIVQEYKQTEKVKTVKVETEGLNRAKGYNEITPGANRKSKILLLNVNLLAICVSLGSRTPIYGFFLASLFAAAMMIVLVATSFQPQQFCTTPDSDFLNPPQLIMSWPALYICIYFFFPNFVTFPLGNDGALIVWCLFGLIDLLMCIFHLQEERLNPHPMGREEDWHSPAWCHLLLMCFSMIHSFFFAFDYPVGLLVWIASGWILRLLKKKNFLKLEAKLKEKVKKSHKSVQTMNCSASYQKLAQKDPVVTIY